jgi:hypothetical protein
VSDLMTHRGRVAALTRSRRGDDPELVSERQKLAAARLEAYIRKTVDASPALSASQRDRLALLLKGGDAA